MKIYRVGMLHFTSRFGDDLMQRLNDLEPFLSKKGELIKFNAEHIEITELSIQYQTPYQLIIDRGSHAFEQAAGALSIFYFRGVHVINNPISFHYFLRRKDLAYAMVRDIGISVPETIILPLQTAPDFDPEDYRYHRLVNWDEIVYRIGLPCYFKPAHGYGSRAVSLIRTQRELIDQYNESGNLLMTVQSCVPSDTDWHVRCLCVGKRIIPMKFHSGFENTHRYSLETDFLARDTVDKITQYSKIINRLFEYEVNAIEYVIDKEGEPWAIEFNNPVPDSSKERLGSVYYEDYLTAMIHLISSIVNRPEPCFMPKINPFAVISRLNISRQAKLNQAMDLIQNYYEEK